VLGASHRRRGGTRAEGSWAGDKDHDTRGRFHLQHACQVMQLSKTRSSLRLMGLCVVPIPTWVRLSTAYHPPTSTSADLSMPARDWLSESKSAAKSLHAISTRFQLIPKSNRPRGFCSEKIEKSGL
jgi:hypothetical protein